jgi:hypothetical protein
MPHEQDLPHHLQHLSVLFNRHAKQSCIAPAARSAGRVRHNLQLVFTFQEFNEGKLADPSQVYLGGKDRSWGVHGAGEEEGKGPGLQGEGKSCCSKKNCDALRWQDPICAGKEETDRQ